MHDRRIDGETHTFGNAGALFMNAMTWYDHKTRSIWSQPWGRGIQGQYKGVVLELLPSQVTTWESWEQAHPETLVMVNDVQAVGFKQRFDSGFVIGLILEENARAYYFEDVSEAGAINDHVGEIPIVIWAGEEEYQAYVREVDGQILTFTALGPELVDAETRTTWDARRGLGIEGPLRGTALRTVPSTTAFDWAWADFYPDSDFYVP